MRRLGIISVVLLGLAFVCGFSARQMYIHVKATSRICSCPQCQDHYFTYHMLSDWTVSRGDPYFNSGTKSQRTARTLITLPRDPGGVLPITELSVVALLCFVIGTLGAMVWLCDSMVAGFGWLVWRLYRWLFALDLAAQARAVVPPETDTSSS